MKTSMIPAGVLLVGEIEGRGELIVAGTVEGPIELEGALTIEEGGEVRGDVSVSALLVRGVLAGTASATESIRVEPTAIVVGDARAPRVNIVEGARFRGRVQMSGEGAPALAPRRRRARDARTEPVRTEPARTEPFREHPRTDAARPQPAREQSRPEPRKERAEPALPPRAAEAEGERPRKRRRERRPPPPNIPAVQRQKVRRKDGAPSGDLV